MDNSESGESMVEVMEPFKSFLETGFLPSLESLSVPEDTITVEDTMDLEDTITVEDPFQKYLHATYHPQMSEKIHSDVGSSPSQSTRKKKRLSSSTVSIVSLFTCQLSMVTGTHKLYTYIYMYTYSNTQHTDNQQI